MENELIIFVIASIILLYGFFSKSLLNFNISGPMFFLLIGIVFSPLGFNLTNLATDSHIVEIIAEIALIIVLFSDSSSINLKEFKKDYKVPFRLLFVGLPLTIVFSTYIATLFFPDEALLHLLLMALILAPTDAALGKAVVTDLVVPEKIRSSINVESGLNDGIVFPMLITTILLIIGHQELGTDNSWIAYLAEQISLGFFFGAIAGYLGAKLLNIAVKKDSIESTYRRLFPVALAILSYYLAEHFGGNGFISAYISGMLFGNYSKVLNEDTKSFLESDGEMLILVSFLVFGLTFVPSSIVYWDTKVIIYSLFSLTLFRMLPVALSLIGLKLSFISKLFIGWFGPRGIASILYVMVVVQKIHDISGHETLYATITLTILLSIILHGLSAKPFVKLYAKYLLDKKDV